VKKTKIFSQFSNREMVMMMMKKKIILALSPSIET